MGRGNRIGVASALAVLVATAQPAAEAAGEAEPLVLAPSSRWQIDFADERCSLIREFAHGSDKIRLQVDSFGPSPGYRVTLSGNLVPMTRASPFGELTVSYSPDTAPRHAMTVLAGELGGEKAISFTPGFLADAPWEEARKPEFGRSVTSVTFDFARHRPFRLETGSMAEPFKVMEQCVDDLLTSWGIDPAQHRARTKLPVLIDLPEGYRYVAVDLTDRYPTPSERRYRAQARVEAARREKPVPRGGFPSPIRIMIDAEGRQTDCIAQSEAISQATLEAACEKWAGPYQPAYDVEGRPVASFIQIGL